jgi:hypothetical protein
LRVKRPNFSYLSSRCGFPPRNSAGPLIIALMALAPLVAAQELPDGPGKDVVSRVCTTCHDLGGIVTKKMSADEWKATVERMITNGATFTSADEQAVEGYLARNFGGKQEPVPAAKTQPSSLSTAEARDLSGVWMQGAWYLGLRQGPRGNLPNNVPARGLIDNTKSPQLLFTPWGRDNTKKYTIYNDPILRCASPGPQAYNAPYAFEFLQTPGRITMLLEYFHEVRRIYMDGREHPKDPNPTAMGHSIGRWEGDTLVVDTVGFEDSPAHGGSNNPPLAYSDQRHLVERIRRVLDGNVLEIEAIDEDPKAFTQPLRSISYFKKDPRLEIIEHNCEGALDYNHPPVSNK